MDAHSYPPPGSVAAGLPLSGLRLLIDPGHGGFDAGHLATDSRREADWVLDVGLQLAQLCQSAGAGVALTRDDARFVPLAYRRAAARESRADLVLGLHLGRPEGHSAVAVHFGRAWWQRRRAEPLIRNLLQALDRRMPLHRLDASGRRVGACVLPGGRWTTLGVLIVAHPAADGGGGDGAAWAEGITEGLLAFHSGWALAAGSVSPAAGLRSTSPVTRAATPAQEAEPRVGPLPPEGRPEGLPWPLEVDEPAPPEAERDLLGRVVRQPPGSPA